MKVKLIPIYCLCATSNKGVFLKSVFWLSIGKWFSLLSNDNRVLLTAAKSQKSCIFSPLYPFINANSCKISPLISNFHLLHDHCTIFSDWLISFGGQVMGENAIKPTKLCSLL